uniref:beta strand repeat-containing protein n=1 Tax=Pusillimonas sp. TaxID=3040095 RepID=UPI0037CC5D38
MNKMKRQAGLLRVTALSAALMGVYGAAAAQPSHTLLCKVDCGEFVDQTYYGESTPPDYFEWVVKAEGDEATLTLTGGSVTARGHKTRGVGSTAGSSVVLNGVTIHTETIEPSDWGSHGVQAQEADSELILNNVQITTSGEYSNGIQAGGFGEVRGTGVTINANGGTRHTFGTEANNGGKIQLTGGSITVQGENAGGARAYTGNSGTAIGEILLDGVDVSVTGGAAVGLMAGDKDGTHPSSAGNVTFNNATVTATGKNAIAARAQQGGVLSLTNAAVIVNNGAGDAHAVLVDTGSTLHAKDIAVQSNASGRARGIFVQEGGQATIDGATIETTGGSFSHAMQSDGAGSVITATGVNVKTTGYAAAAVTGGEVVLNGGTFDIMGTTALSGWDSAAGFVVGGYAHTPGSKLSATNITLINSAPVTNAPPEYTSWALRVGAPFSTGTHVLNAEMSLTDSEVIASGQKRQIAAIQSGSHLVATNSRLVSEEDAGIVLYDNASLTLDGSTVETKEESLRSSFSNSGSTQDIIISGPSAVTQNNGTLLRVARTVAGADGVVNMTLQSGSHASGNIRNYLDGVLVTNNQQLTNFVVQPGAIWAGIYIDPNTSIIDDDAGDQNDFNTGEGEDVAIEGSGSGTQNFNGNTNIGGSVSVGRDVAFNGPTSIGSDLHGQDGTSTSVQGPATIGGSINGGAGTSFTFNDSASISGSVAGVGGSHFNFNGTTDIGGGVQGTGANMAFAGPANIGGSLSGQDGSAFSFSTNAPSNIGGDVDLNGGSSIAGGSTDAPINIGGNAHAGAGSTLGGNLNVAGAVSGAGGNLSPGNSIGSQTYGSMGEFTGAYVAEVNAAGNSDLITIASGNADLTGIDLVVSQENGNGGYKLHHDYTIIQTEKADGIGAVANNKFASEALDDTFAGTLVKLDPAKFGANTVNISLTVDGDAIDRTGYSANQNATLDGVLSVAGQNASADAVMFMQPEARK